MTAEPSGDQLTDIERLVLWHVAHGNSYATTGRSLGYTRQSIANVALRVIRKLNATNITHAVYLGIAANLIGEHPDCGTRAAYLRHLKRHEPACHACKGANAAHAVAQRAGQLTKEPA